VLDTEKYGPWAVIAGGSESLGASLAGQVGEAGINLVLIARKEGPLEEVAQDVRRQSGVQVRTVSLDLARDDMLARIRGVTDDVEVGLLVYNAGASHRTGPFLEGSLDDAFRTVRVNVLGQVSLTYHFGLGMVQRGRGGVITIGSMAGITGMPGVVVYSGSKAFGQMFTEGLWAEWTARGVNVLHVPLGSLNSPAMARLGLVYGPEQMPMDPDWYAQEILDRIGDGPVFFAPHLMETFLRSQQLSRRAAVEETAARVKGVTGPTHRAE
jgi:short-subunit dehydrogenase